MSAFREIMHMTITCKNVFILYKDQRKLYLNTTPRDTLQ